MSHHHNHHESEKHRKQREKNLRNWLIFVQSVNTRVTLGAPALAVRAAQNTKKEPKLWSQKLSSIRNRLDNSRRLSDDRFNRFAGTEDGGGRGR